MAFLHNFCGGYVKMACYRNRKPSSDAIDHEPAELLSYPWKHHGFPSPGGSSFLLFQKAASDGKSGAFWERKTGVWGGEPLSFPIVFLINILTHDN